MIIISRKRLGIIMLVIFIGIFTFAYNKTEDKTQEQAYEQVTATPVSNKVVIVDAGHGTPDEGAESSNRNNRSTNKLTNCFKITKFIRK